MASESNTSVGSVQAQISVSFEVRITCSKCKGVGLRRGKPCRTCQGTGGRILTETVTEAK